MKKRLFSQSLIGILQFFITEHLRVLLAEANLAKQSIFPCFISAGLALMFIMGGWVTLLALACYGLHQWTLDWPLSIFIILIFNGFFAVTALLVLKKQQQNFRFVKTRQLIRRYFFRRKNNGLLGK